jgi:hypothetical protein
MITNRFLPALLVAMSLLAAVGCTTDDDAASDPTEESTASSDGGGGTRTSGGDAFCESYLAADALVGPAMVAGPDAGAEVIAAFGMLVDPPTELELELRVMSEQVDVMFGGAASGPSDEDFDAAAGEITDWVIDNCDLPSWDVVAGDDSFEIDGTLPIGSYALVLDNRGVEFHEAQVIQINPGEEATLAELLQLPEEEVLAKVTPLSAVVAAPGESDRQIITFTEPGRYGIIDLLPVGSTPEAMEAGSELDGAPHFTQGMFAEFTVLP